MSKLSCCIREEKKRFIIVQLFHLGIHLEVINVKPRWFCLSSVDRKDCC